jgi:hypothetical protein
MKFTALISRVICHIGVAAMITAGLISSAVAQDNLKSIANDFAKAAPNGNQTCQLVVLQNGAMVQNIGSTILSSQINAGMPGLAEVTTSTGSFDISVDLPNGFSSAPQGGNSDVVFESSLSGHGKTNFGETPGNIRVRLKNGVTQLDVNLKAQKLQGSFPAGYYVADLTLRCE